MILIYSLRPQAPMNLRHTVRREMIACVSNSAVLSEGKASLRAIACCSHNEHTEVPFARKFRHIPMEFWVQRGVLRLRCLRSHKS